MTVTEEHLRQGVTAAQAAFNAAEAQLEEARAALTAKQNVERGLRQRAAIDAVMAAPESDFYTLAGPKFEEGRTISHYAVSDVRPYVLPFGRDFGRWSPFDVENAAFGKSWLGNSTALIVKRRDQSRTKPSRLIFTSGVLLRDSDKIGNVFVARHDQTNAILGVYEIVGLVFYSPEGNVARSVGETPDVKLSQNTYK